MFIVTFFVFFPLIILCTASGKKVRIEQTRRTGRGRPVENYIFGAWEDGK